MKKLILGQRLKELRKERGLTQVQLAEKLNINAVTYLRYETAQRQPPLELLFVFSDFFSVTIDYLLGNSDY